MVRWTICSGKYQFWQIIVSEMWFSKIFSQQILHIEIRAKRVVIIFTARLALISIWRIFWGKIFENYGSDTLIHQNWYFPLYRSSYQYLDFALISFLDFDRNSGHNVHCYLMPELWPTATKTSWANSRVKLHSQVHFGSKKILSPKKCWV